MVLLIGRGRPVIAPVIILIQKPQPQFTHPIQQHDFAWFADKRFLVRTGEVTLPHTGRTVETQVLFTPANAGLWADAITYVNESVRLYSEWVSR